jgi:nitrite reductase/ring-hydroxylating ferredoxin subunit
MSEFIEAIALSSVPPGEGTTVTILDRKIALFNVDGHVYAMDDTCKHAGSSLGSGLLEGKFVKCRAHGWKYDLTSGFVAGVPDFGVTVYPVKIIDGTVWVSLTPNECG